MKKKLLAFFTVAVMMAASLTGCGKETETTTTTISDPASQSDAVNDANGDSDSADNANAEPAETVSDDISDGKSFIITLYPEYAPLTCENFEKLVSENFYNGLTFHRVVEDFMAQGGDPAGNGTGGSENNVKGEFATNGVENTLSHQRGVISMARSSDPDSASSQFFICYTDCSFLDGSYAAFGEVTEGMEVIDAFLSVPRTNGSDGAVSSPTTPITIKEAAMTTSDNKGNHRVKFTMEDFLSE